MTTYHTSSSSRKRLEQRRMKAGKLFQKGCTQAEVARTLRVTPAAVNQWHIVWKERALSGLKSKGHPGAETALTKEKGQKLKRAILKGPRAFGYATDLSGHSNGSSQSQKRRQACLLALHGYGIPSSPLVFPVRSP